jgi:putative endonuclease
MRATDILGATGEGWAADYVQSCGMTIVARNWRCPDGEIDIAALDDGVLVVCEVKTRRGTGFGSPLEAVGAEKLNRLYRLGYRLRCELGCSWRPLRVDAIGIIASPGAPRRLEHVRGIG